MDSSHQTNINISNLLKDAIDVIKNGGLVVAKTDTIYGILGNALNRETIEKIYQIKGREENKPFIILIPSIKMLKMFNVKENQTAERLLNLKGITVIFDIEDPEDKWYYLHRGKKSLAFRIPDDIAFLKFLEALNLPVVAPSANPSGLQPAEDINQAIEYFQDKINLYVDSGKVIENIPSTVVKVENGKIKILRKGKKGVI